MYMDMKEDRKNAVAPMSISLAVRTLRVCLKMTQPTFAHELGVKTITVAKWESGDRAPRQTNFLGMYRLCFGAYNMATERKDAQVSKPLLSVREALSLALDRKSGVKAKHFIVAIEMARKGHARAREIINLSEMDEAELKRLMLGALNRNNEIDVEHPQLGDEKYLKFVDVMDAVQGRRDIVSRCLASVRRELERLGAKPADLPELVRIVGKGLAKTSLGIEESPVSRPATPELEE